MQCDKCVAEYQQRFVHYLHGTDLYFCAHHANEYLLALIEQGFQEDEISV